MILEKPNAVRTEPGHSHKDAVDGQDFVQVLLRPDAGRTHRLDEIGPGDKGDARRAPGPGRRLDAAENVIDLLLKVLHWA